MRIFKYINPRPSKIVFRRCFESFIAKCEPYQDILDCACANGKFRDFFLKKTYYGVDFDAVEIRGARKKYSTDTQAHFFVDNMINLETAVKDRIFDLVVSTHTISSIPNEYKFKVIQGLSDRVKPNGSLILQIVQNDNPTLVEEMLRGKFEQIIIYPYRGLITQLFEKTLLILFKTEAVGSLERKKEFLRYKWIVYSLSLLLSYIDPNFFPSSYLFLGFKKCKV